MACKLSIDLSGLCFDYFANSLVERANSIVSNPLNIERFYVSCCQAFLYFMKKDSARMISVMPVVLTSVLDSISSKATLSTPTGARVDMSNIRNLDSFVYNYLLGYSEKLGNDSRMSDSTVKNLTSIVLLNCLSGRNIFFMWYGMDYRQSLQERVNYLRSGIYTKAPVGFDELDIPLKDYKYGKGQFCNDLNSLVANIYNPTLLGVSVDTLKLLQHYDLIKSHIKICERKSVNSFNPTDYVYSTPNGYFTYDYPLNMLADILNINPDVVAHKGQELISLYNSLNSDGRLCLLLREFQVLKCRYASNLSLEDTGKSLGEPLSKERVRQLQIKASNKISTRYRGMLKNTKLNIPPLVVDVSDSIFKGLVKGKSVKTPELPTLELPWLQECPPKIKVSSGVVSTPVSLPFEVRPVKSSLEYSYSQYSLDYLSSLLWQRAVSRVPESLRESSSLFCYYMCLDSKRMQSHMPYMLEYVLNDLSGYSHYAFIDKKYGLSTFVNVVLLCDYSGHYSDVVRQLRQSSTVREFREEVLTRLLYANSVYYMWYGSEYKSNLEERLGYLKSGYYNEAFVGVDELGIKIEDTYSLNSVFPDIYNSNLPLSVLRVLQSMGFIHPKFKICSSKGKGFNNFDFDYPLNVYVNFLNLDLKVVSDYYSDLYAFSVSHMDKMYSVYGDVMDILACFFKDGMLVKEIAKKYDITTARVKDLYSSLKSKVLSDYSTVPVEDTPWDVNRVVCPPSTPVPLSIVPKTFDSEPVNLGFNLVDIYKVPNTRTPLDTINMYNEHLKVEKEADKLISKSFPRCYTVIAHQKAYDEARNAYFSDFFSLVDSLGMDARFLSCSFHSSYYRLCYGFGNLSVTNLNYADCNLLLKFMNNPKKENFSDLLSNQSGCNYENFEGLRFGLASLLVRSGLYDASVLSDSVFITHPLVIPAEDIKFVYTPYSVIPDSPHTHGNAFMEALNESIYADLDNLYSLLGISDYVGNIDDMTLEKLVNIAIDNLCKRLKQKGFRSLNAVGFYLMNGMEDYFDNLSDWELKILKIALQKGDFYKNS